MAVMWSVLMADSAVTEEVMVLVSSCDFKLIEKKRELNSHLLAWSDSKVASSISLPIHSCSKCLFNDILYRMLPFFPINVLSAFSKVTDFTYK